MKRKHELKTTTWIHPPASSRIRLLLVLPLLFMTGIALAMGPERMPFPHWPFEENGGRYPEEVAFVTRTSNGLTLITTKGDTRHRFADGRTTLVERLIGGAGRYQGEDPASAKITRFRDPTPGPGQPITAYTSLRASAWPGIETRLRQRDGAIERLFRLAPGIDAGVIRVQIQGAESLQTAADGGLIIQTQYQQLQLSPPLAWQPDGELERRIEVAYRVEGDSYGFNLGLHDPGLPVVIDPLIRSTYSGGTGGDQIRALATDASSVYVAGITFSGDFPVTGGAAQGSFDSFTDAFVARYNADLSQLLAATYLGGSGYDEAQAISLASGNVFVAGRTGSTNFPGTGSGAQTTNGGDFDGFVARLSADLGTLVRASYFGGSGLDAFFGLAVTASDVYATGFSQSPSLPGTSGAAQTSRSGSSDAIAARFSLDLTTLLRATYLGGSLDETSRGRPLVLNSALYVPGTTNSHDFPQTSGGLQSSLDNSDASDAAFVSRLALDLSSIQQSTYYATTFSHDRGLSLATAGGDIFLLGESAGADLPGTSGGALPHNNLVDLFLARLSSSLGSVVNATYFGGSDDETAGDLLVDGSGIIITGTTSSSDLPGTTGGIQPTKTGPADVLLARFDLGLTNLQQSSYLGGIINEEGLALGLIGSTLYVAGREDSTGFPGTGPGSGGAQENYGGNENDDGFIAALSSDLAQALSASINDVSLKEGNSGSTPFVFSVTLNSPPAAQVQVSITSANISAQAGQDYGPPSPNLLNFTPQGPLAQNVTVLVSGDTIPEGDEQFRLSLSSNDVAIADGIGLGTIINDDLRPGTPPFTAVPAAVPGLSPLGLLALGLLVGGLVSRFMRRG